MHTGSNKVQTLQRLLRERIVIIDGAMGTMVHQQRLDETAHRGERFKTWTKDLTGLNDVLCLTQPRVIEGIHGEYLKAGADIIETNTFNAQAISLADYGLQSLAYEINVAAAQCARRAVDAVTKSNPDRVCFVAGALGPTTRTCSLSTDVTNPAARSTHFDEVSAAYYDQARGLLDGGADLLLVETIFDPLNSKAAFFAILKLFSERNILAVPFQKNAPAEDTVSAGRRQVPILASITFIQAGPTGSFTGQTVEAIWNTLAHVPLLSG